jgi:hypothetical protein
MDKEVALVNLAKTGMLKIPMATILLIIPGLRIEVMRMALKTAGKPYRTSAIRMMASSGQPREKAAREPKRIPKAIPIDTVTNPTRMELAEPFMTRLKISLPYWSVPNQWRDRGP